MVEIGNLDAMSIFKLVALQIYNPTTLKLGKAWRVKKFIKKNLECRENGKGKLVFSKCIS